MTLRLDAVVFDVTDAHAAAAFRAGLLDRELLPEPGGALVPGDLTQVGLRFRTSESVQTGPRQLHLHLTSTSLSNQRQTVEKALRLGGRHHDTGQGPEDRFVVLADPGDNELCVIEPGNGYMTGTGFLGEVICDGSRGVGLFWRDALGWPLVLDEDGQTAIQSPYGGTKISWDPWEDPASPARPGRERQRFDLVAADLAGEAERLLTLGATRRVERDGHIEMADPDGHAFDLRRA